MTDTGVALTNDVEARIEALLRQMTLAEKVALMAGSSMWTTTPIERLGIPAIKVTDGPNGARGAGGFVGGAVTAACFPVGIALAATWNSRLVEEVGEALAEEAQSKGARLLLAPTVNIHRSPLNGRNFECYSEDPYLSARMAVAYITGLQRRGVGATIKHYVCNDSEFERNTISSEVDERTLREIYLPPFRAAVQEAKTWAVMAAYNRVNGVYASEHPVLLNDILKREWGFDGIVMSDWFGTKSVVEAAANGLDLEMPGPTRWRGERLVAAVENGQVRMEAIDESACRILRTIARAGAFETPEIPPEQAIDRPEHRALIRRAAAESMVLLKNDGGILPLNLANLSSIAIIGPNAKTAQIMGGGSAQVNAHYAISPYDGIAARVGGQVILEYEIGCTNHRHLPRFDSRLVTPESGEGRGFTVAYYNTHDLSGEPVHQAATESSEQVWLGEVAPGVDPRQFSARFTARFTPAERGTHTFSLISAGLSRLFVDDVLIIDNWTTQTRGDAFFGAGSAEATAPMTLEAGRTYALRLEYSNQGATMLAAVRLGYLPPVAEDAIERAAALAAQSDVALVFVGLNADWESEGYDRPHMDLVGRQDELVERVAAANPRTIVVLQTGSPVTMPWLDRVAAVLQAWYPGQECGNAIADVLFGDVNPSGRLPQTFPVRLEDNPAYINYPGENGRVRYGEGIFVGYRYYEKKKVAPLFPFGFGLSYTTFRYDNLRLSADVIAPDDRLTAQIDITNTGMVAGQEVVQLYVRDSAARVARPAKELKGFVKVALQPGETQTVTFSLDREALAYWDDVQHAWVAEAGEFEVLVGSSSQDIRARAVFHLNDTVAFGGPTKSPVQLSVDSPVKALIEHDGARAVLERHMPGFVEQAGVGVMMGLTLAQMAAFAADRITPELLGAIAADLARIQA
ncbi:beta-glucosidase [Roseiflexus castenholzii]|uniref:Glycoside hydrolase family 3 domain protein n=1 Tax=Roseiflexus castenholzii (strain DSM 13941 / HLO8) TaxID=383372 RepID=A7NHT7_ROSCS|nr:glycoside hydrolase family 3 C-terminal domain-containing protein [Roseiflexus castenholzii]ABU57034.1 glycoside hydrolase family 3 domain protein [Roseiflexus castenholzii DSM 13941]